MKLILTALTFASLAGSAVGFVPATTNVGSASKSSSLPLADAVVTEETEEPIVPMVEPIVTMVEPIVTKSYPEVNGWTANPSKFCLGLPGSSLPFKDFDPLGLIDGFSVEEIKRYRESEVTHGRVAMLATVGYLVGESSFHPLFGGSVLGPANSHLAQVQDVAPAFFVVLTLAIGASELYRAKNGWTTPPQLSMIVDDPNSAFGARLNDDYYPGDLGFDPLGLKPSSSAGFATRQTKELNNGRLAMIGAIGMLVQEQISHEPIMATLHNMGIF